jgi:hypothetical protein
MKKLLFVLPLFLVGCTVTDAANGLTAIAVVSQAIGPITQVLQALVAALPSVEVLKL